MSLNKNQHFKVNLYRIENKQKLNLNQQKNVWPVNHNLRYRLENCTCTDFVAIHRIIKRVSAKALSYFRWCDLHKLNARMKSEYRLFDLYNLHFYWSRYLALRRIYYLQYSSHRSPFLSIFFKIAWLDWSDFIRFFYRK